MVQAGKRREDTEQKRVESEKTGQERKEEEGAQSEKQKLPVKRNPSFNESHFWGIKERGPWQNQRAGEEKETTIRKKRVSAL